MKVTDLPTNEQPSYRLDTFGPTALSCAELLQLVWGFKDLDTPTELLARAGSLRGLLQMTPEEMKVVKGIGDGAVRSIKAALELGSRMALEIGEDRPQIHSPADAADLMMPLLAGQEQEHFYVILLDTKSRVIQLHMAYKGTANTIQIRTAELLRPAIRRNAVSIILVHNHPSGDPMPSPEDVNTTSAIVQAAKSMDIDVLDHIIIGNGYFVSLKERRLGF